MREKSVETAAFGTRLTFARREGPGCKEVFAADVDGATSALADDADLLTADQALRTRYECARWS